MTSTEDITLVRQALELAKLDAETERIKVETRKLRAEAVEHENRAIIARVERRAAEAEEATNNASDENNFTHRFYGHVDEDTVLPLVDQVNLWHRRDAESAWHIVIDSGGGYCNDGFHLIDQLVEYSVRGGGSHYITMTVRGMAASMAGIILQAADERVMGPNAQLLIHPVGSWIDGKRGEMFDKVERIELLTAQARDLFLQRANGNLPLKDLEFALERKDWWIGAKKAKKLGLVDRIG
ncbi:hypothetical protein [Mycobacterium phage WXIN]|nr:hypothetical protein [Mycobacterium phage WXIN]